MHQTFPNFSFRSYVSEKYKEKKIFETKRFLLRVLQISPYLVWDIISYAFVELLLVTVFAIVLYEMSQGRDMIVGFFEPGGLFSIWRLIFTTQSIILYSLSMWIIPASIFELTDKFRRKKIQSGQEKSVFKKHLFFVHRMLAMIPFWGFAMLIHHQAFIHWIIIGLVLLEITGVFIFYNTSLLKGYKKAIRAGMITLSVLLLVFVLCYYQQWYFEVKAAYSLFLIAFSVCVYMLYFRMDCRILAEKMRKDPAPGAYPVNSAIYISLFVLNLLLLIGLIYVFDLKAVVPESLMLVVFAFYVFFLDFIYYVTNIKRSIRYVSVAIILITVAALFFTDQLPNHRHYEIDYLTKEDTVNPKTLSGIEDYFSQWSQRIKNRADTTVPYPIILVSGEGGGSRAGYWFSQALMNLEQETNGNFRDHIFSMSTVSGSSVGLGAMLSWWQYAREHQLKMEDKWKELPKKVFRYNYIGGGIHGLVTTDFWKTLVPFADWTRDRNSELQEQEAICIQRSLLEIHSGKALANFSLFNKYYALPAKEDELIMKRDMMSFYYNENGKGKKLRADLPLIFLNTCRSDDGRRGIFSPVRLSDYDFVDAIDLSRFIYSKSFKIPTQADTVKGLSRTISLASACNTTELFPFFSASAFVHNLGNFVDGGYHDNSGLKTTMEVRSKLLRMLSNARFKEGKDYKVYVLYLKNVRYGKTYYPDNAKVASPLLQPAIAITNVPFTGNASYFEEEAYTDVPRGQFIRYQLYYRVPKDLDTAGGKWRYKKDILSQINDDMFSFSKTSNSTWINFPLARWLSSSIITKMEKSAADEMKNNINLGKLLTEIKQTKKIPGEVEATPGE